MEAAPLRLRKWATTIRDTIEPDVLKHVEHKLIRSLSLSCKVPPQERSRLTLFQTLNERFRNTPLFIFSFRTISSQNFISSEFYFQVKSESKEMRNLEKLCNNRKSIFFVIS